MVGEKEVEIGEEIDKLLITELLFAQGSVGFRIQIVDAV